MKAIDLLNKMANGEGLPEKIKYQHKTFELDKDNVYIRIDKVKGNNYGYKTLFNYITITSDLNDEVEIIEEDKEIEDLKSGDFNDHEILKQLVCKTRQLISEVNELKKGK